MAKINATVNGIKAENVTSLPIKNKNGATIANILLETIDDGSSTSAGFELKGTKKPNSSVNFMRSVFGVDNTDARGYEKKYSNGIIFLKSSNTTENGLISAFIVYKGNIANVYGFGLRKGYATPLQSASAIADLSEDTPIIVGSTYFQTTTSDTVSIYEMELSEIVASAYITESVA